MTTSIPHASRRMLAGFSAGVLALALLVVTSPSASAVEAQPRLDGETRVETAIAIADQAHDTVTNVVLATSAVAADSLPGNALAGALDGALLLTEPDDLSDATATAINALGATDVYILGGTGAVSQAVEDELAADYDVQRIGGETRYETSAMIAEMITDPAIEGGLNADIGAGFGGDNTIFVTRGDIPFDAVAASGPSYFGTHPILLTRPNELPAAVESAIGDIGADQAVVLGGTAAVSEDVAADVATATASDALERVSGANRNVTAANLGVALIEEFANYDASSVYLTTGAKPFDALTVGQLAGAAGDPSPVLLTGGDELSVAGQPGGFLAAYADEIVNLWILGGTGAVPTSVEEAAEAATDTTFDAATYTVDLAALSASGASGTGTIEVAADGTLTVNLDVTGVQASEAHPQHIHGLASDANATCPTEDSADQITDVPAGVTNPDEVIGLEEGLDEYGPVLVPLVDGDGNFPTADANGDYSYSQALGNAAQYALGDLSTLENRVIVIHGLQGETEYLPSVPVACGEIETDAAPTVASIEETAANEITVTFDEAVAAADGTGGVDADLAESQFTFTAAADDSTHNPIDAVADGDQTVTLTFDAAAGIDAADDDSEGTLAYTDGDTNAIDDGDVVDVDGVNNALANFEATPTTVDETAPTAQSAAFTDQADDADSVFADEADDTISVTYDETPVVGTGDTVTIDPDGDETDATDQVTYTCDDGVEAEEVTCAVAGSDLTITSTATTGTTVTITDDTSVVSATTGVVDAADNAAAGYPAVINPAG